MDRKLVTIRQIDSIEPITDADAIECAHIGGWQVVVKKGEFKPLDPCVFFEIDSLLPHTDPRFEFMRPRGFRVKTTKLRGCLSQGLALPLSAFPEIPADAPFMTDCTGCLGVEKYEPPIPAQLVGNIKGTFPGFLNRTDECRVQNLQPIVNQYQGKAFNVSEKADGTSFSCFLYDGVFGVCSRNLELLETEGNTHWKVARKYDLETVLSNEPRPLAIQGEIIGFGIQKNRYALKTPELYIFDIYDIDSGRYYTNFEIDEFCIRHHLTHVPFLQPIWMTDMDTMVKLAEGVSVINPKIQREGIVLRNYENGRISFKIINNKYLLRYEE